MLKKLNKAQLLIATILSIGATSAFAAIPTEVETMLTGLSADFSALIALLWPVMALVTGGFILFKWVRRGAKSAT